jgi:LAO/AO transport system kinase
MTRSVNPNISKILQNIKRETYTIDQYVEGIVSGNRNLLSKAITLLESSLPEDNDKADQIIKECLPYSGKSRRIGITGVPGVGKSTFIDYFGKKLIEDGHRIAILAIDPSSSISGGSILGDKTRMETLSAMEEVFIRPTPSSGTLGGVAAKTRESIILCEAAGFDTIIIETVGVGQSEYSVASMVDLFMLLLVAGTGDELQGIKRGIMEMCDIVVFTKDDGDNGLRTNVAKGQFKSALHLFPPKTSGWTPEVLSISSVEKTGFSDLNKCLIKYFDFINSTDFLIKNRKKQSLQWLHDQIVNILKTRFYSNEHVSGLLHCLEQQIESDEISPISAAKYLVDMFEKH